MKFLANENFPKPSIDLLRSNNMDVLAVVESSPGISDESVMRIADLENRIILIHDSDYGTLVFKNGYRPKGGVVYFRLGSFSPTDPALALLGLIDRETVFSYIFTVVSKDSLRQRKYFV